MCIIDIEGGSKTLGKFVALEIGSRRTKVVYGIEKKDELILKDYRIIENTDKIFNPDGDLNINEIHPLLKNVMKEMKIRKADCYLTVGGQNGIVRLREMPLVKVKEMKDIVRFEAEQFLPYNIEGFYIDFRVNQIKQNLENEDTEQGEVQSDHTIEVMIVAAPKETVDEQVLLVDKLKLNIKRVDYYTDAIYCYFKKYILKDSTNTMVVDLGANGMKLTMFHGDRYFANIFSEIGIEDLVERFSEQNNLSIEESVHKLIQFKKSSTVGESFTDDNRSKLDLLREKLQFSVMNVKHQNILEYELDPTYERLYEPVGYEITKMMEFFKTRQFGMNVNEIYIIGGGANLTQFTEFTKYYHNIEVKLLKDIHTSSQIDEHDFHLLVPAIGGLLKGGN